MPSADYRVSGRRRVRKAVARVPSDVESAVNDRVDVVCWGDSHCLRGYISGRGGWKGRGSENDSEEAKVG